MARYETDFEAAREARPSEVLGKHVPVIGSRERQEAIACCLSGDEGWREAIKLLGGAFASDERRDRG